MRLQPKWTLTGLLLAAVLVFAAVDGVPATARQPVLDDAIAAMSPSNFPAQYSAPFVCGWLPPVPPQDDRHAKPGDYATMINIHNHTFNTVTGSKRVDLFYAMGQPPAPRQVRFTFTIVRERVLEVDCTDIWGMLELPAGTFTKGALHIGLSVELPVAGVYTSQTHLDPALGPDAGAGISIDVEPIEPFFVEPPV